MSKVKAFEPTVDQRVELEAAIDECLAEMTRAEKRMARRQSAIERLKAETRALLTALDASV
jgi:hypothetical protein